MDISELNNPPFVPSRRSSQFQLRELVSAIQGRMGEGQVALNDMRQSGALELAIATTPTLDDPTKIPAHWPLALERLEGPIAARPVKTAEPRASRFRYFLDGAQVTLPVWRLGLIPVVFSLTTAGLLHRDERGEPSLPGTFLSMSRTWLLPLDSGKPSVDALIHELMAHGEADVLDPLLDRQGNPLDDYHDLLDHYGHQLANAQAASNNIRAELEKQVLSDWIIGPGANEDSGWIVVDGRLPGNVPRAVGLVKTLRTQYLVGNEAEALFGLPPGHRTTAFRYVQNRPDEAEASPGQGRTMWYMRFWDSHGQDARHSLVRIEVEHDVESTDEIDEISSWLLAERLPRATIDARWPTLLYPIHLLERMLKRRMDAVLVGWPS